MAYNKDQINAVGDALFNLVMALRDGVGIDDTDEGVAVLTAFTSAADEFKADTDAALLHLAGRLADRAGDARVNEAGAP